MGRFGRAAAATLPSLARRANNLTLARRASEGKVSLVLRLKAGAGNCPWQTAGCGSWREFRLATLVPSTYTYPFHAMAFASVAQRQSTGFVNQWLWVQIPPLASGCWSLQNNGGLPRTALLNRKSLPALWLVQSCAVESIYLSWGQGISRQPANECSARCSREERSTLFG